MKILVNTASTFEGGAIQVAVSFIEESKKIEGHEFFVILGNRLSHLINKSTYPVNFTFYEIDYRPAERILSFKSRVKYFKRIEAEVKPDVVFTTSGAAYWKPKAPHLCGFNIPQSVYPESSYFTLIPFRKKLKWRIDKYARRYFFKKEGKDFVVQTEDVNSRLRFWFKTENVFTVSNTCSSYYMNPTYFPNKLPDKKKDEFRFLTFYTFRPHKNIGIILQALDYLSDNMLKRVKFVLTIPQENYESFVPIKYREYIYNVGPVIVKEGPSLYTECDAAFLPTLLECFSATYPEAMAMKKPIMASDLSFARSICQDAALYFDPHNPIEIARKIEEFVLSESLRTSLIDQGNTRLLSFGSAEKRAQAYIGLCEKIFSKYNPKK